MALSSVDRLAKVAALRERLATVAKATGTTGLAKATPRIKLPHGTIERGIKEYSAQQEARASVLSAVGLPEFALKRFFG